MHSSQSELPYTGTVGRTMQLAATNQQSFVDQMSAWSNKLYVPQGYFKNSYDAAVNGITNAGSFSEGAVNTVLAAGTLLPAGLEEIGRGVMNIPSAVAGAFPSASDAGTQIGIASDSSQPTDARVIAGLTAVKDLAGAFTDLGSVATIATPGAGVTRTVAVEEEAAASTANSAASATETTTNVEAEVATAKVVEEEAASGPLINGSPVPVVDQAITGIQWGGGIKSQGMPWENYLEGQLPAGSRLPPSFPKIDFFDDVTGLATSAKTLDTTTAAKIADPSQVYYSLKTNVDALANFEGAQFSGVNVDNIAARELQVAVPANTTSAQWLQISKAVEYGQNQGVAVKITMVKP